MTDVSRQSFTPFKPVTLGRSLAALDLGWLSLRETLHEPRFRLAFHSHENATVNFLLEGGFEEDLGRTTHDVDLDRPLVVAKPGGEPHANRYGSKGARCLLLEVRKGSSGSSSSSGAVAFDRPAVFTHRVALAAARGLLHELRRADGATPLAVEGIFFEIVSCLDGERPVRGPRPAWLDRAVALISDRALEPIRIGDVAREAGVHPVHLAREFRRRLRTSPGELMRTRRLAWARDALSRRGLSLAEIAAAAGLSDQSHMTRLFRARYGISPGAYRRRVVR